MKKSELLLPSLLNATGVFLYVFFVSWTLSSAQRLFSARSGLVVPVFMLLLLVVSAAITGLLILGKPVLLFLEGRKKDALAMFFATLGWLVCFLIAVAAVLMSR